MNESRQITFTEALREALREEMLRDQTVFLLGEDIRWGPHGVTTGLREEFGDERVRNTPISETAIIGFSLGAALTGMRPIPELMLSDLLTVCMDEIANQTAMIRYISAGKHTPHFVIRVGAAGIGSRIGAQHSQNLEAWFMHIPGLMIAYPSTPYDAKGLIKTAIRGDNPTLFFEHKWLYSLKGPVPEEEYTIPFGEANILREGKDITIFAYGLMARRALIAAERLNKQGIDPEVVDPRTLLPLDKKTILESVKKTGRILIVEEDFKTCGVGAEIAALIAEEALEYLDAPIMRVANPDVPISPCFENHIIPDENLIIKKIKEII